MNKFNTIDSRTLCRPLDAASIAEYPEKFGTSKGKFIRIGNLIMATPYNRSVPKLRSGFYDLVTAAVCDPTLYKRVKSELEQADIDEQPRLGVRNPPSVLHDAGQFDLQTPLVVVSGLSADYGRASEAGRTLTTHLFREILGDEFMVFEPTASVQP